MTRNIEFDNALTTVLERSNGDVTELMASDLQDPPEVIPHFLRAMEKSAERVTEHVTEQKPFPIYLKFPGRLCYRIASWASDRSMHYGVRLQTRFSGSSRICWAS